MMCVCGGGGTLGPGAQGGDTLVPNIENLFMGLLISSPPLKCGPKGRVSGFVGHIPLPLLESTINRNH